MLTDLLSDMNVAELDNLIDTIASIDNLSHSQSQSRCWRSASPDNGDSPWRPFSRSFSTPGSAEPTNMSRSFHVDSTLYHVDQHASGSSAPQQPSTYGTLDAQHLGSTAPAASVHPHGARQLQHHVNHFQLPSPATTSTANWQQQQQQYLSGVPAASAQHLGMPTPPSSANLMTSPMVLHALSTSDPSGWGDGAGQAWSQSSSPMYPAGHEHRALHFTGYSSVNTSPALSGRSPGLAADGITWRHHQATTPAAQPLRMSQSESLLATSTPSPPTFTAARPPALGAYSSAPSYLMTQGPSAMSIDEYESSTLFSSLGYSLQQHPQHQASTFAGGYPGTVAAAAPSSPASMLANTSSTHAHEATSRGATSRRPSLPAMTLGVPRRSRTMSSPVATSPALGSTNSKPGPVAHESSPHMALGGTAHTESTHSPNSAASGAEPRLCADCSCSTTVQWRRRKRVTVIVPQPGTDNHIEIQLGATHNDDALEGTVRQLSNVYGGPLDLSQATFTSKAVMLCNACGLKDMYHSNRTKLLLLGNN